MAAVRGARVAVVGGSIAGCAGALAATRAGAAEVVVFERSTGRLQDLGVGLALHNDRYAELAAAGYLDAAMPWVQLARRPWVVRDGAEHAGREIAALPMPFRSYSWGSLWRELRGRIPASVRYRTGTAVAGVEPQADGVRLRLADGAEERFDLVVGADGYRSLVRAAIDPDAVAGYGGYLAWRGTLPADRLPDPPEAFREADAATVVWPGGHMIVYRIPGREGTGTAVNWVFYAVPPPAAAARFADPTSTHPRAVPADLARHQQELVDEHFPPYWQEVIARTPPDERFVQPMYDMATPRFADGRLALLGDAAAIARPNTGSGAIKALQDAAALEHALGSAATLDEALAAYSAERAPLGRATVELGRSLGRAQVTETPDWAAMDQRAIEEWWQNAGGGNGFGGHRLGADRPR
ncbi:2-polyprenyl-6-methoxyphenol hydroxylase-like FAD-dependent oxidoreductase [Kitasatospora sp. GAS204A]|uniref:FAD-dependent monooxygenase n=1 Tax=unclassified Kitasatospora TaxID=2633591 RepID=UPI002473AA55|nr:FAD-dependent monooxygenase [Kitasatospora sp. GAS204B]MDH6120390.1 2-polyprenyl-6-methoxyphenol hydroxylase-like FAD-dependent oxidoreductase [Kitasatospora sp. GAS204B]